MRKGKMCAQVAHASMKVIIDKMRFRQYACKSAGHYVDSLHLGEDMYKWLTGKFTKVVVSCDSKEELLDIYASAIKKKLDCAIIEDSGATEFNGKPTLTCVAIGPGQANDINEITGKLKLL